MTVSRGQTALDLAIQAYGSAEYLFTLLEDNDLPADLDPEIGKVLELRAGFGDLRYSREIDLQEITIATGGPYEEILLGIGGMAIEGSTNPFKVS